MADGGPPDMREVKVVLLGDTHVGKSSLAQRFVADVFDRTMPTTIGAAFLSKVVSLRGTAVKFQIWDTAGQEKYRSLAPMYYRGARAAIIVYDITAAGSFDMLQSWVEELRRNGPPDILIALAGNKLDLAERRKIDRGTATKFAEEIGAFYIETSAATGANVEQLFVDLAEHILRMDGGGLDDDGDGREDHYGDGGMGPARAHADSGRTGGRGDTVRLGDDGVDSEPRRRDGKDSGRGGKGGKDKGSGGCC